MPMVTDTYSKMIADISMRSVLKNNGFEDSVNDREKESLYRSGSAPPTVEGSLSAFGGLMEASGFSGFNINGGRGFVSEEELRADPNYVNYYYSEAKLNPRLPPPLISKEDWRFAQRLHGGASGGLGGIGEKREGGNNVNRSLFTVQPGKEDNGISGSEWGGDGLIGLPGLGLGSRQKSFAEIIQDDLNHGISVSRHPSRPASRNAFDNTSETPDIQFPNLHYVMPSIDGLHSGGNKQTVPGTDSLASHTYASALGASLSRSSTPDPQLVARAPSPSITPIGGGRVSSGDKRNVPSSNSDLAAAFLSVNISANDTPDNDTHSRSDINQEIDDGHKLFKLQGAQNDIKGNSYLNNSNSGKYDLHSAPHSTKGSYQNNSLLIGNDRAELEKPSFPCTNSYLKGSSTPTFNGRRVSPSSHYQIMDKANSAFPVYGFSGYAANPSSPSMIGSPIGGGNLPPLFENAAAASGMGMSGMDASGLQGGFNLGPNLLEAAAALQNIGQIRNTTASPLQLPLMDPLYASHVAALTDPALDREYMNNGYMDLHGAQKAYLGALHSAQKSQFPVPYIEKSGTLNHGYYGNPGFSLGMLYPGSPMAGSLFPNSSVGSGSPVNHSKLNLRFSSDMRHLAGVVMGSRQSEAGGNLDESFASSLLDEFKSNKTKCLELSEIAGHVVEFSADQYGSRFIQQKLETATTEEKNMVFHEIMPHALSLVTDVFGNYVIQKFFDHGTTSQIRELANELSGHVLALSLQMYGCRVIQKAIELVELDQQTKMVLELDGNIIRCVRDQNGNHVIQKGIECIPEEGIQFIISTFYDQVVTLSTHPYGCRVIQRVLEHCHDPKTQSIMMDEILKSVCMLAQDQYGNYVVQHVLEHGKPHERSAILKKLSGQIVQMSQQKFASNVIEKCLAFGTPAEHQILVNEMLGTTDENEPLQVMMKDQFANYVVQKVLETCDDQQLELILNRIKVHLNALKKYTYGKHIVARVEKLVATGEKRISILAPRVPQLA